MIGLRALPVLASTLLALATLFADGRAMASPPMRNPAPLQLDEHAKSAQADFDALQRRLDALAPLGHSVDPWAVYQLAKAQAWLAYAFDARAMRDRSGVIEEAMQQSRALTAKLEGGDKDSSLDTPIGLQSMRLREDLWRIAEEMKRLHASGCGASKIAQFEVQLVQAGHAYRLLGWRHSRPYLQVAERLSHEAQAQALVCPEATLPLRQPKSITPATVSSTQSLIPTALSTSPMSVAPAISAASIAPPTSVAPAAPPVIAPPRSVAPIIARPVSTRPRSSPPAVVRSVSAPPAIAAPAITTDASLPEALQTRVYFGFNRATIGARTATVLDGVAAVLKANAEVAVGLSGHADTRGNRRLNLALSRRRAEAVQHYLERAGIAPERLKVFAFGMRQPVSAGRTELDYARNRRVDFVPSKGGKLLAITQENDLQIYRPGRRRSSGNKNAHKKRDDEPSPGKIAGRQKE